MTVPENNQPNIIYILADDLGYGEVGVYGQRHIETPNIDNLSKTGMKFLLITIQVLQFVLQQGVC